MLEFSKKRDCKEILKVSKEHHNLYHVVGKEFISIFYLFIYNIYNRLFIYNRLAFLFSKINGNLDIPNLNQIQHNLT